MKIQPVVLSGGAGTRLWPLSRDGYPKQFLSLTSARSLFQDTLHRLQCIEGAAAAMVVCNEKHRFLIAEQAQAMGAALESIVLEPAAKNTAPAIALAALKCLALGDDPLLLVLPSDHVIQNTAAFAAAVRQASALAQDDHLVTFGIVPTSAHTGYGYIQTGTPLSSAGLRVQRFVEKPDRNTAQSYLHEGGYLWNSGMFLFKASVFLAQLTQFNPDIVHACTAALKAAQNDLDFCRVDAAAFASCPADSVDYAVMEKTRLAAVVPLDADWNDVGTWTSVWQVSPQDACGNAVHGDVLLHDAKNSFAHASSRLVCLLGVQDLTVVETPDVVMVAHHERAQDVKKMVEQLQAQKRPEASQHRQVYRPWGHYDAVDEGPRFKVKRITVKPGEKLSVQMHHHRAEHWVVVSGTAKVLLNQTEKIVSENESIFIPVGSVHSLENPGKLPLEIIEVQTGSYLGEDDIVRLQDRYGRQGTQN